jgi:radical SAM superfamily enzyme YgiQ (UPF0313 family)
MADICLVALNARYQHSSLALRYLKANLGKWREVCELLELTLDQRPIEAVEQILEQQPRLIGFSIYIWNVTQSLEIIRLLKRLAPHIPIVVGGPEVSYEWQDQEIVALADYLVTHEGEKALLSLVEQIWAGQPPQQKVLAGGQPQLDDLQLPYSLYTDHDLAHRVIYVEASRGCPFRCEFCLSSLDKAVRYFPLTALLEQLQDLLDRGARQFKFIDRTFNLRLEVSSAILDFFWERYREGLFLHFEMVPDRFPEELRERVSRFPPGAIQFEIGIQTFNDEVGKRISRRQDLTRLEENLTFLRQHTGVHIHADLIAGLPGETVASFAQGFDRLVKLGPQEIQLGILKRLRGTPILRHDQEWGMCYSPSPPYEVLATKAVPFAEMMQMKRFARLWEVVANRGRFPRTLQLLLGDSPFERFNRFTTWAVKKLGGTREMPHLKLAELLYEYLIGPLQIEVEVAVRASVLDYTEGERRHAPSFLFDRPEVDRNWLHVERKSAPAPRPELPARQARHQASLR